MALSLRQGLPAHVEFDDLVGAGVLGLIDAVDKFDAAKQVKLETYARHRIRGAVLDGLRTLDPVSRDLRRQSKKFARIHEALEAHLQRPVTAPEMSCALGMGLEEWYRAAQQLQPAGWDGLQPYGTAGATRETPFFDDLLPTGRQDDPFEGCYEREQREILARLLARLPERQRQVISLYYQQELTMREIGARLGVDESRVSHLHAAALRRLRSQAEALMGVARPSLASAWCAA